MRRRQTICLAVLLCCAPLSCVCLTTQTKRMVGSPFPDIDFARIERFASLAFDITDLNDGRITEEELTARHSEESGNLQLRQLPDLSITYVLIEDKARKEQILVLPGTTNFATLSLDLQRDLVPDDELGISLHEGFRDAAQKIRTDVHDMLNANRKTWVVGYSFGGATGVILGAYLDLDGYKLENIVTFGQPRVTNAAGAEALEKLPIHRIVAADDPVAVFPEGDFAHCGDELVLLDGPFVALLLFGTPDYTLANTQIIALNDTTFEDHKSYPARILPKVGIELYEVQISDEACFIAPKVTVSAANQSER